MLTSLHTSNLEGGADKLKPRTLVDSEGIARQKYAHIHSKTTASTLLADVSIVPQLPTPAWASSVRAGRHKA